MKRTNALALFAILMTSLFFSEYATAQDDILVEIINSSGEKRKICIYKGEDRVAVVPQKCFVMNVKEKLIWNREGNNVYFQVKVFRPGIVDRFLYTRQLPASTWVMQIGKGNTFSYSNKKSDGSVTKYRLKVCNQRFNQEIYFAVSFETNDYFVTEGWWSVKKGKCVELAVSDRLKRSINLNYGNLPQTYYYAESHGDNPQFWAGGSSGRALCVNDRKAFQIMLVRGRGGNPIPGACDQLGQKVVSFRRIDTPKTNEEYYYLTF